MMGKHRALFAVILYFLNLVFHTWAEPLFSFSLEGELPVRMYPRSKATVIIRIENRNPGPARFSLEPILPGEWKQIIPLFPLEPAGGGSDLFFFTFFAPRGVLSGNYAVHFTISDLDNKTSLNGSIPVEILQEWQFELKLLEKPEYIIAGDIYTVTYVLYNTGNTETRLVLDAGVSDGFPCTILGEGVFRQPGSAIPGETGPGGKPFLVLQPGATSNVQIRVETPSAVNRIIDHRITFTAGLDTAVPGRGTLSKSATTYVEIVPVVSGMREMYHKLPLDVKYNTSQGYTGRYAGSLGVNLYSKGTLDEAGVHHLEAEIHKELDLTAPAFFDKNDQFTLEYRSEHWKLAAGDRGYSLSPLTENFGYGRGLEVDYSWSQFSLGTYYQQNVWDETAQGHAGAFFNYKVGNESFPGGYQYLASLNLLGKLNNSVMLGLYQDYKPIKPIKIEAEAVASTSFTGDLSFAWLLRANGDHKWVNYNLTCIKADPHYTGYYSDLNLLAGNLGFRMLENTLKIYGGYLYEDHNALLDISRLSAALNNVTQGGIDYLLLLSRTEFSFLWKNNNRYDRLPVPDFHYNENIFRLKITQPLPMFKIQAAAEVNLYDDILNSLSVYTQDYFLGIEYNFSQFMLFNFFSGYNWKLDTSTLLQQKFSWGTGINLIFSELLMDFQFKNNLNFTGDQAADVDLNFILNCSYLFRNLSKLSANLNYAVISSDSDWKTNFILSLEYAAPYQIPLAKKKNIGSIKGVVYDLQNSAPVPGIILRIGGLSAVTDEKGSFIFPALDPGEYYINLNLKALTVPLIPDVNMPAKIQVTGGETHILNIGLTRAVTIKGTLTLCDFKNQSTVFNLPGEKPADVADEYVYKNAPGLIVEITNGSALKRRLTDKNGNFLFEELAPGNWKLKVHDYGIPEYHYIEKDIFEVNIPPGNTHIFEIRILPEKRSIMMIEEGGTLIAE